MKKRIEYRRFTTKRRFGVELEVSNNKDRPQIRDLITQVETERDVQVTDWAQSNGNNYWHIKWDSTCGPLGYGKDKGWEVASFIASGYKDIVRIADVANFMRQGGVEVTKNCGLHIHVEIKDFTPEQAAVLVARWLRIERILLHAIPHHRHGCKYCRLLGDLWGEKIDRKKKYDPTKFWKLVKPTNFNVHDNNQKKCSLNMVNYAATLGGYQQRSTVELRLPEGTLFGSDIRNWARCFLNFVDLSQSADMPSDLSPAPDQIEELLTFFGLEDPHAFYILSKGLLEAKVWLLKRLVAYGSKEVSEQARKKLQIAAGIQK